MPPEADAPGRQTPAAGDRVGSLARARGGTRDIGTRLPIPAHSPGPVPRPVARRRWLGPERLWTATGGSGSGGPERSVRLGRPSADASRLGAVLVAEGPSVGLRTTSLDRAVAGGAPPGRAYRRRRFSSTHDPSPSCHRSGHQGLGHLVVPRAQAFAWRAPGAGPAGQAVSRITDARPRVQGHGWAIRRRSPAGAQRPLRPKLR